MDMIKPRVRVPEPLYEIIKPEIFSPLCMCM